MATNIPPIVIEEESNSPGGESPPANPSRPILANAEGRPKPSFVKAVRTVQIMQSWSKKVEKVEKAEVVEEKQKKEEFARRFSRHTVNDSDPLVEVEGGTHDRRSRLNSYVAVTKSKIRYCIRNPYLNPMTNVLYYWLIVISFAALYNAGVIIARETFEQLQDEPWKLAIWFAFDYTADIIYIIDMIVQCRTGYLEQGLVVHETRKMLIHYIKTKYRFFFLDIVSILPLDLLYIVPEIGPTHTILRINRILRLHRLIEYFNEADSRTNYPNVYRIFNLFFYIMLLIHWNACFYFIISRLIGLGSDDWVYPNITDAAGFDNEFASISRQYLYSLYWSTLTLTTIGELPGPITDWEYVFVILNFLAGVFIFATIVGMVGGIITNMNARKTEFQSRLDNIKQYMKYRGVGKELQARVIKWFTYNWTNKHSLDEQEILHTLPDKLHAEIAIQVHMDTLSKVKLFEECEPGLLQELVVKLTSQVYSPGDYICRKGDIGKEMYIIKSGKLQVVNDEGKVLVTLSDGSCFGEISLLSIGSSGNKRTANVVSVGFSELFSLSKADLLEVLVEFPEAKAILEEKAKNTLNKDGQKEDEKEEQANPTNDEMIQVLEDRIKGLETTINQINNRLSSFINQELNSISQRIHKLERSSHVEQKELW